MQIYMVEWVCRNFDVFPGCQKIPAMRNITLYSVRTNKLGMLYLKFTSGS